MIDSLLALHDRIARLEAWKAEALVVVNNIDIQAVGKALGLTLGKDVGPAILPGILALQAAEAELKSVLREYLALSSVDGNAKRPALRERLKALSAAPTATPTAFEVIAATMRTLTDADWKKIEAATLPRLLEVEFNGEDTPANRVSCRSIITNALFDIRDAARKP